MRIPASTVAVIGAMVHKHPELMPILQEHLDDQEGEVLPHLVIADVEQWVEDRWPVDKAQVTRLLEWLEPVFATADDDVADLIAVSFIEHLPCSGPGSEIRESLGPAMREYADRLVGDAG